jgi:hypothetical protein
LYIVSINLPQAQDQDIKMTGSRFQAAANSLGQDQDYSQSLLSTVARPVPIALPAPVPIAPSPRESENGGVPLCVVIGAVPAAEVVPICCIKACKHKDSTDQLRACAAQRYKCTKFIHSFCYGVLLIRKHAMPSLINKEEDITYVACSKRCHKKVFTALSNGQFPADINVPRLAWEKDGKLGPEDINNSMNILLEWLTENGGENYNR